MLFHPNAPDLCPALPARKRQGAPSYLHPSRAQSPEIDIAGLPDYD